MKSRQQIADEFKRLTFHEMKEFESRTNKELSNVLNYEKRLRRK